MSMNLASYSNALSTRTSVLLRKLGHWNTRGEVEKGLDVEADAEEALLVQEDSVMYLLRVEAALTWFNNLKVITQQLRSHPLVDEKLKPALVDIENAMVEKIDIHIQGLQATTRQLQRGLAWAKSVQDWVS
jgi:hypothetical protein